MRLGDISLAQIIIFAIGILFALTVIGLMADKRAAKGHGNVTPGLSFLPGDLKYESPSGKVRVYFPITTSIVASLMLTALLWLFR